MSVTDNQAPSTSDFRLCLICLAALSVSLPIAWISLAKVLLFVFGLVYLIGNHRARRTDTAMQTLWTPRIVLALLIVFAFSLLWSQADTQDALSSFVKHAKLMGILLIVSLVRSAREARVGVMFYAGGQAFLLLSSWMMFAGIPIPWSADAPTPYVVFSSYLDQSIMFATAASVFWHLRGERLWPAWVGITAAALALVNALLVLEGRTGYAVGLTLLSLGVMWAMPARLRLAAVVSTPLIALLALSLGSTQVQERVSKIVNESQNFAISQRVELDNSSGWRLNAWHRSLQAIAEKPVVGHGVGAWTPAAKKFEGDRATQMFGEGNQSNPHQEYLLWGVELGIGGLLLLLALMVCITRDALQFQTNHMRATLSVASAMAVACLFNSALYDDLMGDFFCVSLGLMLALGARNTHSANTQDHTAKQSACSPQTV